MGRIPDRWLEYTRFGKPIEGVPIIAFKTPLSKHNDSSKKITLDDVQDKNEFTPHDLCNMIWDNGFDLAVVIDLTNTFRYYNGDFFCNQKIQYEKLKCEGHKVPDNFVVEQFSRILNDVIYQHGRDSKKLVGIHCTHGVNRTGYVVCRYLIESLGYQPAKAIQMFNNSRGHNIEREEYINELMKCQPQFLYRFWEKELIELNWMRANSSYHQSEHRFIEGRKRRNVEHCDNFSTDNDRLNLTDDNDDLIKKSKKKRKLCENFVDNVTLDSMQGEFYCDGEKSSPERELKNSCR